ncbi:DUF305 domain-containing protein [Rhodococcoides trifolii]|uniref:DUF305 domain-containing protein n=1 Tax=Rhodococcoides trifolii TaxID=908250 RepID=A0A917CWT1_9NOCA|nr:DUF305 domain-containing protein [Rhodococcus trifolii]
MIDTAGTDTAGTDTEQQPKRSQKTALLVIGAIGLIVIGFAVGFLVQMPLADKGNPVPADNSVDVGFAQDMTVHHNQAIEMATIGYTDAVDPLVKNLAYDILTTQQNQVGQMQGWLALWDKAPLSSGGYMAWMTADSGHSMSGMSAATTTGAQTTMPGMASADDMARLRTATGSDVDVLFLQLMLRHHQGGLEMMQYGATYAETPAVRQLAQTMVNTQTSESQLMTQMLTEKGAQPL